MKYPGLGIMGQTSDHTLHDIQCSEQEYRVGDIVAFELGYTALAELLGIFPAWTDAAIISREANIPSIIWGPGELNCAHSPQESIRLEDVILARKLYTSAALCFTGSI